VAVVAGVCFRLRHIGAYPAWLDEAYSAFAARQSFGFLWTLVPQYETHPPFYYSLLRVWTLLFGNSLIALRLLGLLCGLAVLPVMARAAATLGRLGGFYRSGRRWVTCIALALTALQPLAIVMTHQVRPYPVMAIVYTVAILAVLELADGSSRRRLSRGWLLTFLVCQALMMWLHALGALFGLALGLALLAAVLRRDLTRADWLWLLIGEILVAFVYLPAFLIALQQSRTWSQSSWLRFDIHAVPGALGSIYMTWNLAARLIAVVAITAGVAALMRRLAGARAALALLFLALVPTVSSLLLSIVKTPVFLDRTLSPVALAGFLLMAATFGPSLRWRLVAVPLGLYVSASAASVDLFIQRQPPLQDWYATTNWLTPRIGPGDTVWAYPNEGALPLSQALFDRDRRMPVRQIPGPMPYFGPLGQHVTGSRGTVSLAPAEVAAYVARPDAKAPATIWLLRLNPNLYDRGDVMLHALSAQRLPIAHYSSGPIDLIGLRRKDLPAVAAPQQPQP
jgi:hypothetical protein